MHRKEETNTRRGKLMMSGTLAVFAMGGLRAETAAPIDKDTRPAADNGHLSTADPDQVRPSQTVHSFDIPAGSIADVAAAMSQVLGQKVTLASGKLADVPSKGVHGVMTAEEAFSKALEGTGIAASFLSPEKITLDLQKVTQSVDVTTTSELMSPKYTAPLRDLPQTLTVIPETIIESTGSTSLVEALRTVPGITFGAGEGGNPIGDRPFLRGVDSQSSTFVDGVRDIGSQTREVFDLESVEVSKGPSGTFAGRGASGGSINLNSKMARRDRSVTGSFSPGTANFFRGTIDGNSRFSNWAAGRLNVMWQNNDVPGRDIENNARRGFSPALLFNMGHRGHVDVNYYDLRSHDIPDVGIPYNNPTFNPRYDTRARVLQAGDGQPLLLNRNFFYGFRSRDFRNEKVKTVFGRAEYNVSEGTVLRNSYRYGKSAQDYIYSQPDDSQGNLYYGLMYRRANPRNAQVDTSIDQADYSGHFRTGSFEHTFATGGEFSRERSWNATYLIGAPNLTTNVGTLPSYTIRNTSGATVAGTANGATVAVAANRCPVGAGAVGGYFCTDLFNPTPDDPFTGVVSRTSATTTTVNQITKTVNPTRQITLTRSLYGFDSARIWKLQATGGIRYDHYNSAYRSALNLVTAVSNFNTINDLVNYQGALAYKPTTSGTIYGAVSKSSTPPGNSLSQGSDGSAITSAINIALPPETTRSEEVGTKWDLFGSKALATLALFQADTQNVRITQADGSIAAAGARQNRGIDVALTGNVTRKLQLFGGYTYMHAILQQAGGAASTGAAGLMNGRRFPNTPENSFSVTSSYAVRRNFTLGGGVYGVGKVFGNDSPTTPKWVAAYVRVDAYGSYQFNKHLELQGNLQNLTDKAYFSQAYTTHYATLAPGRMGRMTLNVRF